VIAGKPDGRRTQDEIVVFGSTGTAVQDTDPAAGLYLAIKHALKAHLWAMWSGAPRTASSRRSAMSASASSRTSKTGWVPSRDAPEDASGMSQTAGIEANVRRSVSRHLDGRRGGRRPEEQQGGEGGSMGARLG
jgi:hypothetical protein